MISHTTPVYWFKQAFEAEYPEEKIEYLTLILECEELDSVLWSDEALALVWNNKGIAYSFLGMDEDALECFRRSAKLNNEDTDAWYNMGTALFNLGRYEEAIECYNLILVLNPDNKNAWVSRGDVLQLLGKHDEAINCYGRVHKGIEPDCKLAAVMYREGLSYFALGKYGEAAKCFTRALEIDPEHQDAAESLNAAMSRSGQIKENMEFQDSSQL